MPLTTLFWETLERGEHEVGRKAEVEVQRTIKRAELTAFLCLLRKVCGPIKIHVDNKGIIGRLRRGEKECMKPRAGDADLWTNIWEELHELVKKKGILVEVAHVKAHRTKKENEKMTKFGRFVTEGNEKADELAKAGAMLDEGFVAEVRADTLKQGREEVYVALQYAASFRSEASNSVARGSKQVSMHEVRKRKQTHEDASQM